MIIAQDMAAVPFHFWSVVLFVFGTMVGSFLNVCIHRMPLGQSIVSPRSHCPHCGYSIPWVLNIPLLSWLMLRGRCRECGAPIAIRYVLVELLTGLVFLGTWITFGRDHAPLALAYCALFSLFIAATFIDFEHFIIPDEITLGGIGAGFVASFLVPALQHTAPSSQALIRSFWGIALGGGIVYAIVRGGKLLFGRQRFSLPVDSRIVFAETSLHLPDREIPYEELFYRKTDAIVVRAKTVELHFRVPDAPPGEAEPSLPPDRGYKDVCVRLAPHQLKIDQEVLNPEEISRMEAVTDEVVVPREAMGLGDVKFMASIGAFLGAPAVVFSLMLSAVIGSVVGVSLIALRKREWSSRIPYGPYIALAATVWVFGGEPLYGWWVSQLRVLLRAVGVGL